MIKMQRYILYIFISLLLLGCNNTHHYSYRADKPFGDGNSGYIAGLPVMFDGVTPGDECISEVEHNIDKKLKSMWKEKYVPISEGRKEFRPLINALKTHLSNNSSKALNINLESILNTQKEVCNSTAEPFRYRYVILPRSVIRNSTSQMILHIGYAIPLLYVIIYGNIPIPLAVENENIPVYTLTLIDLENRSIVAEDVIALKENVNKACAKYPDSYLENMAFK